MKNNSGIITGVSLFLIGTLALNIASAYKSTIVNEHEFNANITDNNLVINTYKSNENIHVRVLDKTGCVIRTANFTASRKNTLEFNLAGVASERGSGIYTVEVDEHRCRRKTDKLTLSGYVGKSPVVHSDATIVGLRGIETHVEPIKFSKAEIKPRLDNNSGLHIQNVGIQVDGNDSSSSNDFEQTDSDNAATQNGLANHIMNGTDGITGGTSVNNVDTLSGKDQFVSVYGNYIISKCKHAGILPSLCFAQAGKETQWGTAGVGIGTSCKNLFGIKGNGSGGKSGSFAKYLKYSDSIDAWVDLISTNSMYKEYKSASDYKAALDALAKTGYCPSGSDPKDKPSEAYSKEVRRILETNKFYQYDTDGAQITDSDTTSSGLKSDASAFGSKYNSANLSKYTNAMLIQIERVKADVERDKGNSFMNFCFVTISLCGIILIMYMVFMVLAFMLDVNCPFTTKKLVTIMTFGHRYPVASVSAYADSGGSETDTMKLMDIKGLIKTVIGGVVCGLLMLDSSYVYEFVRNIALFVKSLI